MTGIFSGTMISTELEKGFSFLAGRELLLSKNTQPQDVSAILVEPGYQDVDSEGLDLGIEFREF